MDNKKRGLFLIDGVHKSDNTIDGIKKLMKEYDVTPVKLVWIGGTEKIKSPESFKNEFLKEFGIDVIMEGDVANGISDPAGGLKKALFDRDIDLVLQLSGSPQVNRDITNRFASISVSHNAKYVAGGTVFEEKVVSFPLKKPSMGLYATDKRVGKTAFGVYVARLMSGIGNFTTPWKTILMTHSRGGPPLPPMVNIYKKHITGSVEELTIDEIYNSRFRPDYLEGLLKFKLHGASDVYEDALILSCYLDEYEMVSGKNVPEISVIGCRRAGAGYYHEFVISNVEEGLKKAEECPGNYILHEGSGGEHPPVRVDGTITLVQGDVNRKLIPDFPGLDGTDCIIIAHCQPETVDLASLDELEELLRKRNSSVPIIRTFFEPELIGDRVDLTGKNIMYLSTAPEKVKERLHNSIEKKYGCKVICSSFNLSRDDLMRHDIDCAMNSPIKPDIFLIEIKARGVEGAKYIREKYNVPYRYLNNVPVEVDRNGERLKNNNHLDISVLEALNSGVKRFNKKNNSNFPVIDF